ncbi:M42 family metallopeptidase [Deinococcus pimensis]|uniref:M42 family metallopeptidase n=1 Tax=Deinococcus pimensis TaxID=309888 RepID=UPI0004832F51|nr:M42 family metallopeptidase [Deinococcus pimensis]
MTQFNLDLVRRLSEAAGVPGREENVRAIVRAEIEGLVDELGEDPMGNLVAVRRGTAPEGERRRVMLTAHMDEIGFMVRHIDERGFLRLQPLGFFDPRHLIARPVTVWGAEGPLPGVMTPGGRPVHIATPEEQKKVPDPREFYVDLGLGADAVRSRVRVGDSVTLDAALREVGDLVCGKALDNRAVVALQVELLRALHAAPPRHDVYAVFTVQEEVGLRGAGPAAYAVRPDLSVVLDTTLAVDTPGVGPDEAVTRLGEGVGVKLFDASMISTRWLVDELVAVAEEGGVPYQLEVLPLGGTDGGPVQRSRAGVPTVTLSLPTRYIHTVVECVHRRDWEAMLDLTTRYLTR